VAEIAAAFLDGPAAVEKRLVRAKKVLAGSSRLFDLARPAELRERLPAVQRALYLLFNEGYHGACSETAVRVELTDEALRLARLLLEHPQAGTPSTHALAALMCLHAARMPGRFDSAGEPCPLFEQDRSRWNARLLAEGLELLDRAATGDELSEYHLEAGIAAVHAAARRPQETRWDEIVPLYDALLGIRPSPVVALGRAIAIAELEGAQRGLAELRAIEGCERLSAYPFYPAAFGEFELRAGRPAAAREHFRRARALARNPAERSFLEQRLLECEAELAGGEQGQGSGP
jgi:RNA polymerase sigma-70 factor (ECF subfamily)